MAPLKLPPNVSIETWRSSRSTPRSTAEPMLASSGNVWPLSTASPVSRIGRTVTVRKSEVSGPEAKKLCSRMLESRYSRPLPVRWPATETSLPPRQTALPFNLRRAAIEQLGFEDALGIAVIHARLKVEPAVRGGQVLDLPGQAHPRFAGGEAG
jgi:hypothetical protein